jgi:hypothetical protein
MRAVSVGAVLSAPFLSISSLKGLVTELVLDTVAAERNAEALAALLALSAATDGEVEALAGAAAASMDPGIQEPPWAKAARRPVGAPRFDLLSDRDRPQARGLVVTVEVARSVASLFMRFHPESLITERINYIPVAQRQSVLAWLEQGTELAAPYHYVPRAEIGPEQHVDVVNAISQATEENLLLSPFPPYPPTLAEVLTIRGVTIVPALLVLLRKFQGSASGLAKWNFGQDYYSIWT